MNYVRIGALLSALAVAPPALAQDGAPRQTTTSAAQEPPAAAQPAATTPPSPTDPLADLRALDPAFQYSDRRHGITRIGSDFTLPADAEVTDVTVVGGDATIDGRVDYDVLVAFGNAEIGAHAVINGSLTVVGGVLHVRDGAAVRRDLLVVGGTFDAPPNFAAGSDHIVLDRRAFGGRIDAALEWLTRGPLWGRLIVPSLAWMWPVVVLWLVLTLILSLLLARPVAAAVETLSARPLTCSLVGLLVLLLAGPASVLLAVSIVGIVVIPFIVCGLILALVIGKIAVTRRLGRGIVSESAEDASRPTALRSVAIGLALLTLIYMVPVLGLLVWTLGGVFGVGAATMAFLAAYRRENPPMMSAPVAAMASMPAIETSAFREPTANEPVFEPTQPVSSPITSAVPPVRPVLDAAALSLPRASFMDRALAGVLDAILVAVLVNVFDPIIRDNAVIVVALAYFIGFWAWKGTTVGGIIMQLRVIRVDGSRIGFAEALVRGLATIFSAIVLGIGLLWILRDPERQAWQDRIAGTYVVKVPRDWPL